MIGELVLKKEETARKRSEMLASQGAPVIAPTERNEVKVSDVVKRWKIGNGRGGTSTVINGYVLEQARGGGGGEKGKGQRL